jgi:hypothetical protein
MDAFIILLLVIIIICWSCYRRKVSKAAYGIISLDLLLRIFAFIGGHIGKNSVSAFLSKWPDSILTVADKYTSGLVFLLIAWAFVILMLYFVVLTLQTFFKK